MNTQGIMVIDLVYVSSLKSLRNLSLSVRPYLGGVAHLTRHRRQPPWIASFSLSLSLHEASHQELSKSAGLKLARVKATRSFHRKAQSPRYRRFSPCVFPCRAFASLRPFRPPCETFFLAFA